MIEWEPNKNDANLNMPVDGQVASICWNEQTKLLTMSLAYSAVYGMGERYNGLNQNDRIVKIEVEEKFCNQGDKSYCPSPFFFTDTWFSYNVTTDLINSGTEFNYIFANNDMMAQGCYNALKDAGKENIPIVSTGGSPDGFKMLQDGIEAANMTAPVSIQGVKTFMNLYNKVALGEDPAEKFTALPVIPVSADDTSSYIAWDDYAAAYKYLGENK